jgi:hypothetical protein
MMEGMSRWSLVITGCGNTFVTLEFSHKKDIRRQLFKSMKGPDVLKIVMVDRKEASEWSCVRMAR